MNQKLLGKDVSLPENLPPHEFAVKHKLALRLFDSLQRLVYMKQDGKDY